MEWGPLRSPFVAPPQSASHALLARKVIIVRAGVVWSGVGTLAVALCFSSTIRLSCLASPQRNPRMQSPAQVSLLLNLEASSDDGAFGVAVPVAIASNSFCHRRNHVL